MNSKRNQIAKANSQRYEDKVGALERMEGILQDCDWMIVCLEQIRNIYAPKETDKAAVNEIIKRCVTVRIKIRNLQRAWEKFAALGHDAK